MATVVMVILSTASGQFGGTERTAAELAQALKDRGVQPVIHCVGRRVAALDALAEAIPVEYTGGAQFSDLPVAHWRGLLRRYGPRVVVRSKNCVGLMSWRLDLAVRLERRRYVSWEQHTARPIGEDPSVPRGNGWFGRARQTVRHYLHFRAPHCTVAVSEAVRTALVRHYGQVHDHIALVYPGVDFSQLGRDHNARQLLRTQWGLPETAMVVGSFGRLTRHKGNDLLIRAVARARLLRPHADIRCVIGGVGSDRDRLERIAHEENVQCAVLFAGWQDDRRRFLNALDVLALPSSDEGLGLVLIEGIACGALALSSSAGGMPEVFGELVANHVVKDSDPEAWALRLLALHDDGAEQRRVAWNALNTLVRRRFEGPRQWNAMGDIVLGHQTPGGAVTN